MPAIDPRFICAGGYEVFNGNELLVKGILETEGGVGLFTGYPGSPVAGCFDLMTALAPLLKEKGVRAFQSNNEALAAAAANGSQMVAIRTLIAMKSVGVHVASDALALGNLAGCHPQGGVVVIMGDYPWCDSTQVPVDSRFICEHLRMPAVEPGNSQQLKDWVNLSFKLSQAAGCYIGYVVTNAAVDGGGSVQCRENHFPEINTHARLTLDTATIPVNKTVLLPPRTWQRELEMPQRLAQTAKAATELGINQIHPASEVLYRDKIAPLGFIATGNSCGYLRQVLTDAGLFGVFPILDMGMTYPVDIELVLRFSRSCRHLIVVEERRSFLEKNIRDTAAAKLSTAEASDLAGRLFGKRFPNSSEEGIPETRGLNASVLALKLLPMLQRMDELPADLRNGRLAEHLRQLRAASKPRLQVVPEEKFQQNMVRRSPTFCPGCPHRDSAATLLEIRQNFQDATYMQQKYQSRPVDMVAHGDTGCYTMLMFPPTASLMHNYSGMGLGAGTGSGIDPFITNKQIVFMGDSTFFHSGQLAISNAVKAQQDLTFIILKNDTTAMTGHQGHAGTELDLMGDPCPGQNIEQIVRGMAATYPMTIHRMRPDQREQYRKILEEMILKPGVKIIIADKECGITHHRSELRQQREVIKTFGYLPRETFMNITPEVCENCLECTRQTGCPGLMPIETDFGRKVDTDLTWCVSDGACERVRVTNEKGVDIKPCPSFEQLTVIRKKRKRYTLPNMSLDKLPMPAWNKTPTEANPWRVHMSGVGGMGIGLTSAILVRAGHKEGYRVLFSEKKGLAIRNGGVFSQITFNPRDTDKTTANIPFGQADLLLGMDVLEAARAIDPRDQFRVGSFPRTAAVVNTYKQATIETLLGQSDFDPQVLQEQIFSVCNGDLSYANDLSTLCERRLGSKQFVNIMMLGVAYQLGLIPVSARSMAWAIKDSIRRDHRRNLKAFNIGRKLALEPRALPRRPQPVTWDQFLTNKLRLIRRGRGHARLAADFERLTHVAVRQLKHIPEQAKYDLVARIYELVHYQDIAYAKGYVDQLRELYLRDSSGKEYAATRAAIWNLAKVMLIKDEPYVAWLLTRPEKVARDIEKYNLDTVNGDRLIYEHFTSPEIPLGPWRLRLKLRTKNWQLKLVTRMKWLRKLPGWHRPDREFGQWYAQLVAQADLAGDLAYQKWLKILQCPEQVSGYREIRHPKLQRVQREVEAMLTEKSAGSIASVPAGA